MVVAQVRLIREHHHKVGAEKLYFQLKGWFELKGIKIGRDKFMNVLRDNGLMIQRKSRKAITTCSRHNFRLYPNLLKEKAITKPNQVWVSDITYLTLTSGFVYLSLITDAYSRKIVGWSVHESLQTHGPLEALAKALEGLNGKGEIDLIHHSDRGVQYCSKEYTKRLKNKGIRISMTEQYDPYENAMAERVNRTLKEEFSLGRTFFSSDHAKRETRKAVSYYNSIRPHASCDYLTPNQAHQRSGSMKMKWKRKKEQRNGKVQKSADAVLV
jgi:transposase InsO family protein